MFSLLITSGSVANGVQRPPLYLIANDLTFAVNVTVEDFSVWTESNDYVVNKINNVFGKGDDSYGTNNGIETLAPGETPTTYTRTLTITASPTNWDIPPSPTWAIPNTGYGSKWDSANNQNHRRQMVANQAIPVYTPQPLWKPRRLRQTLLGNFLT